MDDARLQRIEDKLDDVQLQLAKLPLEILEKHEQRFAPMHRFGLLEKSFWGMVTSAILGLIALGVKAATGG